MIPRHLSSHILSYSKQYPILALVGPRQSGKTTLVKELFSDYHYLSLENLDLRSLASQDPRRFLLDHGSRVILDEVQRVPELFSYLQEIVDSRSDSAQYILTGSSQFLLMEKISQSLAGRIVTFQLYPLTVTELFRQQPEHSYQDIFRSHHVRREPVAQEVLYELLLQGLYPKIHDKKIESHKWYENYVATYVERDVRSLLNVRDLRTFEQFLKLIAAQSGQLTNYSTLSNALGISVPTVKQWISVLETSGIIFILPPYFNNFSKRLVKTPKIYFVDTGLLCYLLSIRSRDHLLSHPSLGALFETFIVSECFKRFHNMAEIPPLYFWRDQTGNEIDLLIQDGQRGFPCEIKLSKTYNCDFQKNIERWLALKGNSSIGGSVIYCGDHSHRMKQDITCIPWWML